MKPSNVHLIKGFGNPKGKFKGKNKKKVEVLVTKTTTIKKVESQVLQM